MMSTEFIFGETELVEGAHSSALMISCLVPVPWEIFLPSKENPLKNIFESKSHEAKIIFINYASRVFGIFLTDVDR